VLQNGFRVPACIRFVKEEDILISATRGGPRLFINIDNYHAYQQGGWLACGVHHRLIRHAGPSPPPSLPTPQVLTRPPPLPSPRPPPGGVSQSFERVKALMRSSTCDARVHYGKASVYSGQSHATNPLAE
jgi:hypothetical protein